MESSVVVNYSLLMSCVITWTSLSF